jgi:TusA-related sulfurtransferase
MGNTLHKNSKTIDTRGMACPYPSFEAVKALSEASSGETVEILTDSEESATSSIPTVLERRGVQFKVERRGGHWSIRFTKP